MNTEIEINLGSDLACKYSLTMKDYLPPARAALYDTLADIVREAIVSAYPSADVVVTCKPEVAKLRGEATDTIICESGDTDASDDALDAMHMVIADTIDFEAETFFQREDELNAMAEEFSQHWKKAA